MRCHIATAITIHSPRPGLRSILKAITSPLSDGLNLAEHLMAGGVATAIATSAMHPLDTIKTLVQSATNTTSLQALSSTLRQGGIPALYKGMGVSLAGQVPAGAIKFAAFESFSQFTKSVRNRENGPIQDFLCAAMAFVCCSVIFVPGELMKQRLQAGYTATLVRDVPYTMFEFGLYSQFKRAFRSLISRQKLSAREEIMIGGFAGGCTGFLTAPLDLAKTKLMTQVGGQYKGILDVMVQTMKTEGVGGVFRGGGARVAWLIPFTAVFFGVHEASKRALLQRKLTSVTAKAKPS